MCFDQAIKLEVTSRNSCLFMLCMILLSYSIQLILVVILIRFQIICRRNAMYQFLKTNNYYFLCPMSTVSDKFDTYIDNNL